MKTLMPLTFTPLPAHAVTPGGWLARQLRIQADGLTGRLDEFWPDVRDSAWFGGTAEGWERAPYWLDGLIPLAWLLKDRGLMEKATRCMDYIMEHQHPDGWLGPREANVTNPEAKGRYDIWAQFLILKVLVQYFEITADERAARAVEKGLRLVDALIDFVPLFDWGQARWFEALIPIAWLYERAPEQWLPDLAVKLEAQGFGWKGFFARWPITRPTPRGKWNFMGHVVNNAMAVKSSALAWRFWGDNDDRTAADAMIRLLDEHHGTALGTFTGDECLAGTSPVQGTELCAAVEYMYSLEHLAAILGDAGHSDRLEMIAFNSLPAFFTRDMWAHQYVQQVNQAECSVNPAMPWTTNGPDANIYGLEPNFGCCTANMHQGWPKFASHLWMRTMDGGIAAVAYAPSTIESLIGGVPVAVRLDTDYPFREKLSFSIESDDEIEFPLVFRIPGWCRHAEVTLNGKPRPAGGSGTWMRLYEKWGRRSRVDVTLRMDTELVRRPGGALSVRRGPLVYALGIAEQRTIVNTDKPNREFPHCDYEMRPASPWNYALNRGAEPRVREHGVDGETPFSNESPPVSIVVKARLLPEWTMNVCAASEVPPCPVSPDGGETELTLVPFGCTHLRIAEFPWYD